jgi:hypothetical protein
VFVSARAGVYIFLGPAYFFILFLFFGGGGRGNLSAWESYHAAPICLAIYRPASTAKIILFRSCATMDLIASCKSAPQWMGTRFGAACSAYWFMPAAPTANCLVPKCLCETNLRSPIAAAANLLVWPYVTLVCSCCQWNWIMNVSSACFGIAILIKAREREFLENIFWKDACMWRSKQKLEKWVLLTGQENCIRRGFMMLNRVTPLMLLAHKLLIGSRESSLPENCCV